MADLPLFISIGYGPCLQGNHGCKGLVEAGGKAVEVRLADSHATDVQPDTEVGFVPEQLAEPLPLGFGAGAIEIGEHGVAAQAAHDAKT